MGGLGYLWEYAASFMAPKSVKVFGRGRSVFNMFIKAEGVYHYFYIRYFVPFENVILLTHS